MKVKLKDNAGNVWIEKDLSKSSERAVREYLAENKEICLEDLFIIIEENKD